MSVIGRLDDQVNEIIIKPVGTRKRPEGEETEAPQEERPPQPPAAAKEDVARDEDNPEARSNELPVWLL